MKRVVIVMMLVFSVMRFHIACAETITACGITVDTEATEIDFDTVRVTDVEELIGLLDQMPNLQVVDMYKSSLKKTELDILFNRYPQITFGWTFWIGDHKVTTDIEAFSTLHGADPDPEHTEENFQWLKFCKNLKAIDVGHNWVKDISWLKHFPELKVLIIAVNHIEDISPLAELKELEYLEMFTNYVKDLTPLTALKNLRDLNIKNNPLADLSPLYEMPQLERLWLSRNAKRISQEQLDMLYEKLPDCEINLVDHPTGGTWRRHPRYDVIYEMFHGTTYIPFED